MEIDNDLNFITEAAHARHKLAETFYQNNINRLNSIEAKINRNIYHLIRIVEIINESEKKCPVDCFQLIDRAVKLNKTCLGLIKQLNFVEAAILSRSLIEFCTTSIAIYKNKKTLEEFSANEKFNSTQTISIAKKYIPEVGKIWGEISNFIIHVNPEMHGAKKHINDDGEHVMTQLSFTCLETIIPEHSEALLDHTELMTYLILYTIEIICLYKVEYKGIGGYAYPNKKTVLLGDSGKESFQRLYNKIYNVS